MKLKAIKFPSKYNDYNPTTTVKLNNKFLFFEKENVCENIQFLIDAYENIICSIYNYKNGIENLLVNLIDSIELTNIDINMTLKNYNSLQNVFINNLIMISREKFTNCRNILSLYVSRNTNNNGFNHLQDNSTIFSNIITQPNKFCYYLSDGNVLNLFNIPIFGINLNDHNNMILQMVFQEDSVATAFKNTKIKKKLYSLSPNIKDIKY